MGVAASYMAQAEDARDQIDWTPEWTRRARGFPVYAALRELGRDGMAAMIDRCCAHATTIADGIGALPGAELVARPTLNQGLIRFRDPRLDASEADHDRYTEETITAINTEGTAFFSPGTWQGRRVMRISVVNWRTSDDDVRRTVEAVARVLARRRAA
jgi:aromatic-L-amino-acid decarboxylase